MWNLTILFILYTTDLVRYCCNDRSLQQIPGNSVIGAIKKGHRQMSMSLIVRRLASIKFLVKCFYSTSSSMNTLFPAVERMALRADFYFNISFRSRSGFEFVTASADHFYSFVLWVNTFLHPLHLFLLNSEITHYICLV